MITCEIDGIPVRAEDLSSGKERAMLADAVSAAVQRVRGLFDDEEWAQLHVRLTGSSLEDLSMQVNGPDYLVERVYGG